MAEVKWVKITTNMFSDEKIDFIESLPEADAILVMWIKLLTQAGKTNANGFIFLTEQIPYTEEMLAHKFRRQLSTVKLALETLKRLEMIEYDDDGYLRISKWDKHQNIEGLDKIKKQNRIRQANYREKQKKIDSNVTVTLRNETDIDIDIDIDKDIKDKEPPKKTRTVKDNKITFAEFVAMTKEEHEKLTKDYGEAATKKLIEILDNYKGANGKSYKSDYRAILNWVVKRYQEEGGKSIAETKPGKYAHLVNRWEPDPGTDWNDPTIF